MSANTGIVAVTKIPAKHDKLVTYGATMLGCVKGSSKYPDASSVVATFEKNLADYALAHANAALGTKGLSALRKVARQKLKKDILRLRDIVQALADAQPTAEEAIALIEGAHMSVKKKAQRNKPLFQARNSGVSGRVFLIAKAVALQATYFWQFSTDMLNWHDAPETMKASQVISGLTPGQTYHFRFRALGRKETFGFSQVVSLIVT